jgi:hypothetical protein
MADKTTAADIVRGEFLTDGKTFVFRLKDLPLSGVGPTADAAFQDLVRVEAASGELGERLKALAADQAGELVRATVIRWLIIALIAFGVVGGGLVGAFALAPAVAQSISEARVGTVDQAAPKPAP